MEGQQNSGRREKASGGPDWGPSAWGSWLTRSRTPHVTGEGATLSLSLVGAELQKVWGGQT